MITDPLNLTSGFAIIGHRGAAGLAPENTLPSFQIALDLGCRGIELDVHPVVDAKDLVQLGVIHDEIQIECDPEDADAIGKLVVEAMESTTDYYKLNCPITGEYKIARSWDGTH